jgi:WD40 repeat protein
LPHEGFVNSVSFSADGGLLVTSSSDKTARIWSVPEGRALRVLRPEGCVHRARFMPDGHSVLTVNNEYTLQLWSLASGVELQVVRSAGSSLASAAMGASSSPAGRDPNDGHARVWSPVSGELLQELHTDGDVSDVQFSPDDQFTLTVDAARKPSCGHAKSASRWQRPLPSCKPPRDPA